ncbi:hypothetical protein MKW92_048886 [Papaver armeniacum]|nr:hypothetical protein MKW92_048886 [Papaver armeniacum]
MNSINNDTRRTSFHLLIHFLFLFLLLISLTEFLMATHGCHEEERRALLDIKSSLQDPLNRLTSWQEGSKYQNCCDWHGILCSWSGDSLTVTSINLRNGVYFDHYHQQVPSRPDIELTALEGNFSPSFFKFTHLRHLDLAFNNFQQSDTPLQFSNLSSLEYLDLSCIYEYCLQLSSTKWLEGLVNLQVLRLRGIDLNEATLLPQNNLAKHISFLSNLKDLDLSFCNISGSVLPIQEFNNLSRLSSLDMSFNPELNFPFPTHLANLTSLSSLQLLYCNLYGSVPYMPQLQELNVHLNPDLHVDLTRMFEFKWPKLKYLGMSYTKLTGTFLRLTSNVPLLETLKASGCSIQGPIPQSLCNISLLRDLRLRSNNFTGTIPTCFTLLRSLNQLDISNNSMAGDVSLLSLFSESNLTSLDLSLNNLTIVIGHHLYVYPKLETLSLRSCNLEGLFPAYVCNLTHLEDLDLSDNNLTGIIPFCIYKLKKLIYLNFSYNNFHGPLPLPSRNAYIYNLAHNKFNGEISMVLGKRLSSIFAILLSGNELSGSVPFSICSKESGLYYLDLSNNELSGIIPTSIGYCNCLLYLNLGTNKLIGNIPKGLEQAKNLIHLQLNDNELNSDPLYFISKLHELEVLNLVNNNFEGNVSDLFGSLNKLKILSLRSNNFSGSIPKEVVGLQELQVLDLSRNNLTGLIPKEICNLPMLISRSNDTTPLNYLTSTIEDVQLQIVSKGILQHEKLYGFSSGIDLSSNNFEGEIPEEIGLLKGLSVLNLSYNGLSGNIPPSVGSMNGLESLDLSYNKLSGLIPPSLASMDFLGYLNLSYNNLSGKIPRGPHFDTLGGDGSTYVNNTFLCGYLTENACEDDQSSNTDKTSTPDEDGQEDTRDNWYFFGVVSLGFIVGFWGLFFGLLLKKDKWWFGYWRFVDSVAVKMVQFFLKD